MKHIPIILLVVVVVLFLHLYLRKRKYPKTITSNPPPFSTPPVEYNQDCSPADCETTSAPTNQITIHATTDGEAQLYPQLPVSLEKLPKDIAPKTLAKIRTYFIQHSELSTLECEKKFNIKSLKNYVCYLRKQGYVFKTEVVKDEKSNKVIGKPKKAYTRYILEYVMDKG